MSLNPGHNFRLKNIPYIFSLPPPWGRRYSSSWNLLLGSLWPLTWHGRTWPPTSCITITALWDQPLSGLQAQQLWIPHVPHLQNSICSKFSGSGQSGISTEIELDLQSKVGLIMSKHSPVLSHWYQPAREQCYSRRPLLLKNASRAFKGVQFSDTSTNFLSISRDIWTHQLPLVLVAEL